MNCLDCGNMNMVMESSKSMTSIRSETTLTIEEYKCPICGRIEKKTIIIETVKRGQK